MFCFDTVKITTKQLVFHEQPRAELAKFYFGFKLKVPKLWNITIPFSS